MREKLEAKRKVIGERIKRLRNYRGMSCHDLAKAAGRSRPYISSVENGMNPPTEKLLRRVSEVLKVDLGFFTAVSVKDVDKKFIDGMPRLPAGEIIKRLRGWRGLSCQSLADKLRITRSYLSSIENGHHPLTAGLHRDISKALGVKEEVIVKGR
ncbi:MAG: helix-turn-helix transcriptional regulator [Planctomycetes bacterium]|nr:helix-turn-helix transcriptional regulator [Planctomycetota bacterium]